MMCIALVREREFKQVFCRLRTHADGFHRHFGLCTARCHIDTDIVVGQHAYVDAHAFAAIDLFLILARNRNFTCRQRKGAFDVRCHFTDPANLDVGLVAGHENHLRGIDDEVVVGLAAENAPAVEVAIEFIDDDLDRDWLGGPVRQAQERAGVAAAYAEPEHARLHRVCERLQWQPQRERQEQRSASEPTIHGTNQESLFNVSVMVSV